MTTKVYYVLNGLRFDFDVTHSESQNPVDVFKTLGIEYDQEIEPDINPPDLPDEK